jgi:hypothetical protein
VALLVMGVVGSALAPVLATLHGARKMSVAVTPRPHAASHEPRRAAPFSVAGLARGCAVARSFAENYLRLSMAGFGEPIDDEVVLRSVKEGAGSTSAWR